MSDFHQAFVSQSQYCIGRGEKTGVSQNLSLNLLTHVCACVRGDNGLPSILKLSAIYNMIPIYFDV